MLGDLLSDANERRTFLVGFAAAVTLGVVLVAVGLFVPAVPWLAVVGVALLGGCIVLLTKLVVTTHVHLRGTSGRLIGLNDRYDATERWLEQYDADVRSSLEIAASMHAALEARVAELKQDAGKIAEKLAALETAAATRDELTERAGAIDKRVDEVTSASKAVADWQSKTAPWIEKTTAWRDASQKRLDLADKASEAIELAQSALAEKLDSVTAEAESRSDALATKIDEVASSADAAAQAASAVADDLESGRAVDAKALSKQAEELKQAESRFAGQIEAISASLAEAQSKSEATTRDAMRAEMTKSTGALIDKIQDSSKRLQVSSSLVSRMRGEPYVQFPRLVTADAEKTLTKLKAVKSPAELRYLERKLQVIEGICEGRLAGSTDDAVARALLTRSVRKKELRILEIGVLFGIGSIFMHQALAGFYRKIRLTLLDPFDGYYGPKHLDPLTGQPVTEDAVRRNLSRCGIPAEDVDIVSAFSSDDAARERVAESGPFDSVVIDGDHSAEGIKLDYERYAELVAPGGVLIVDDYGSDDWPSVLEYTDSVIENDARFTRIAVVGKTIAFRRKRDGSGKSASASAKRAGGALPKMSAKSPSGTSSSGPSPSGKADSAAAKEEASQGTTRSSSTAKPASAVEAKPAGKATKKPAQKSTPKPAKKAARKKARAATGADSA